MNVVQLPTRASPCSDHHRAAPGDFMVGWSIWDGAWLILTVTAVDGDGFVAMVEDTDGSNIGVGRVYEASAPKRPWLIVCADSVRPKARDEIVGFTAFDLEDVKGVLRPWKAA